MSGKIEITLKMSPYDAQRFSVALGEIAEDHRWQAEMLDSVGTQLREQIDTVPEHHPHPGFPTPHAGYRWVGLGLPRKGQWYDDGAVFEESDGSWTDENHQVNIYEPTEAPSV